MGLVRLLEVAANVAILTVCLWPVSGKIRTILSSIPRPYAAFSIASVVTLLGAQAVGTGEEIYPLTNWSMYTTSLVEVPDFVEYDAELSSGREERLLIGQLFPAGGSYLRRRIDDVVESIEATGSEPARSEAVARLDVMLAAIAREYDSDHPGDPVRTIRIRKGTWTAGERSVSGVLYEYRVPVTR